MTATGTSDAWVRIPADESAVVEVVVSGRP